MFISITIIMIAGALSGIILVNSDKNEISDNNKPTNNNGKSISVNEASCIKSLRQAIEDLMTTYGSDYPKGEAYLKEIDKQLALYKEAKDNKIKAKVAYTLFTIRREALMSNPLIRDKQVLFVVRHQYSKDHHNTHTAFPIGKYDYNGPQGIGPSKDDQFAPGGALKILDLNDGG